MVPWWICSPFLGAVTESPGVAETCWISWRARAPVPPWHYTDDWLCLSHHCKWDIRWDLMGVFNVCSDWHVVRECVWVPAVLAVWWPHISFPSQPRQHGPASPLQGNQSGVLEHILHQRSLFQNALLHILINTHTWWFAHCHYVKCSLNEGSRFSFISSPSDRS